MFYITICSEQRFIIIVARHLKKCEIPCHRHRIKKPETILLAVEISFPITLLKGHKDEKRATKEKY